MYDPVEPEDEFPELEGEMLDVAILGCEMMLEGEYPRHAQRRAERALRYYQRLKSLEPAPPLHS